MKDLASSSGVASRSEPQKKRQADSYDGGVKKYQRFEKRHKNVAAHISPAFRCKDGDTVIIGQCRPLSKTVRFNVLKVIPAGAKKVKGFSSY